MPVLDPLPPTIPHAAQAAASSWLGAPAIIENGCVWSFAPIVAAQPRCYISASGEWIVAAIAIMTAGATLVTLDTRLKGREAADILRCTRARLLLTVENSSASITGR